MSKQNSWNFVHFCPTDRDEGIAQYPYLSLSNCFLFFVVESLQDSFISAGLGFLQVVYYIDHSFDINTHSSWFTTHFGDYNVNTTIYEPPTYGKKYFRIFIRDFTSDHNFFSSCFKFIAQEKYFTKIIT